MSPRGRTHLDRSLEKALLETHNYVGGLDEVGHGALAGPVSIGLVVVVRRADDDSPEGLADSKQLTARARTVLIRPVRGQLVDHAVAHASSAGIDEHGIIGALRVADLWALQQVTDRGHAPGVIILDDVADWLTTSQPDLLTTLESAHVPKDSPEPTEIPFTPPVRMEVKTGVWCAVVVTASVLAKVEHDHSIADLDDPSYGQASNKGYASPTHIRGFTSPEAGDQRRHSWHLPDLGKCHR